MSTHSTQHTLESLDLATLLRLNTDNSLAHVTQLCVDSRQCSKGSLFFALAGTDHHGIVHAQQAISAGAQAIVTDMTGAAIFLADTDNKHIPMLVSDNPRYTLAIAASRFYARQPEHIFAVTGTNGKTSTAQFTAQIMQKLDVKAASLGTLGLKGIDLPQQQADDAKLTTPEPIALHRLLANMTSAGVQSVALEASSHGLAQNRLDGVRLTAAALTNITRDHLDYHETSADYIAAKMRLFQHVLATDGIAVLNIDDNAGELAQSIAQARYIETITYGKHPNAKLQLVAQTFTPNGQTIDLRYTNETNIRKINLNLIGEFQAMNILAAAGLAIAAGYKTDDVFDALPYLTGVPGRMEQVSSNIYVDYAHTPDALETALCAIRPHLTTGGKLHIVFGAGGDRDPGKRALMGAVAATHADVAIITDDNPRNEVPAHIRQHILEGAYQVKSPCKVSEYAPRDQAIRYAIENLLDDDILVIAGKGHEKTQEIDGVFHEFDDTQYVRQVLASKGQPA